MRGKLRRRQRPLILEEHVVHLPVLAELAGTVRSLGRLARLGVDLIEREVAEHVAYLARVDVILLERWERRREKSLAERALVVGELDERHRRVGASQNRRVGHTRSHGPARGGSALDGTLAQQPPQLTGV